MASPRSPTTMGELVDEIVFLERELEHARRSGARRAEVEGAALGAAQRAIDSLTAYTRILESIVVEGRAPTLEEQGLLTLASREAAECRQRSARALDAVERTRASIAAAASASRAPANNAEVEGEEAAASSADSSRSEGLSHEAPRRRTVMVVDGDQEESSSLPSTSPSSASPSTASPVAGALPSSTAASAASSSSLSSSSSSSSSSSPSPSAAASSATTEVVPGEAPEPSAVRDPRAAFATELVIEVDGARFDRVRIKECLLLVKALQSQLQLQRAAGEALQRAVADVRADRDSLASRLAEEEAALRALSASRDEERGAAAKTSVQLTRAVDILSSACDDAGRRWAAAERDRREEAALVASEAERLDQTIGRLVTALRTG